MTASRSGEQEADAFPFIFRSSGRTLKLRTFAQWAGVRYETAWRWFQAGKIKGYQLDTKTIAIPKDLGQHPEREIIVVSVLSVFRDK